MIPPLETNSGGLAKDMTLRDWFAGQALVAIMSAPGAFQRVDRRHEMVAEKAYDFADALMIERERGE